MRIIEELSFNEHIEEHRKIILKIRQEIHILLDSKFLSCSESIRNIIITDNLEKTEFAHGYKNLKKDAQATLVKVRRGLYDVVVNYYNNIICESDNTLFLKMEIKNALCHEFQHIRDHKKYDKFIKEYVYENNISENVKIIGERIFFEFNASYQAQRYFQLIWEYNKYAIDTNTKKFNCRIDEIKGMINDLDIENLDVAKEKVEKLNIACLEFVKDLMYDFSLSFGTNAADNKMNRNEKSIDIKVSGIDKEIDTILNSFILGFNNIIDDNKGLIKYSLNHCMDMFECINSIFKKKISTLRPGS